MSYSTWVELLMRRAADMPQQTAFAYLSESAGEPAVFSYGQLDLAARTIAAALQQAGLAGRRAVILYPPGPEYLCALIGCWYAGVAAAPVYAPRRNASFERVRHIVASAQAAVLLAPAQAAAVPEAEQPAWDALTRAGLRWLATDTLPPSLAGRWHMPDIGPDTLAVLQYTSGSTGHPKGVRLCHRHLLANVGAGARAMGCNPASVGVSWLPPYHDMGLIGGVLQPLYSGFPVYLMAPAAFLQRPLRWLDAISRYRATHSAGPNFAYDLCVQRVRPEQLAALDLSSWRMAANGAEPVRAAVLREFARTFAPAGFDARAFFPCYGLAESTLFVTGGPLFSGARILRASRDGLAGGVIEPPRAGEAAVELVACGAVNGGTAMDTAAADAAVAAVAALAGAGASAAAAAVAGAHADAGTVADTDLGHDADADAAVRIVDPATGQPCASGRIGEIWTAGGSVADGYWDRPDATADTFHARLPGSERRWLRTGDLGAIRDGQLYVTGRIKDVIIIRGQNHYPHDIETTVAALHPALRANGAAAFGIDEDGGEQLGLVLELQRHTPDAELAPLAAAVRDAVSRQHQLHVGRLAFVRAGAIPRTSSGKLQRHLARQLLLQGRLPAIEHSPEVAVCA